MVELPNLSMLHSSYLHLFCKFSIVIDAVSKGLHFKSFISMLPFIKIRSLLVFLTIHLPTLSCYAHFLFNVKSLHLNWFLQEHKTWKLENFFWTSTTLKPCLACLNKLDECIFGMAAMSLLCRDVGCLSREGVIIDHDVIVNMPLGRFI